METKELTTAELQEQVDGLQKALGLKKAKEANSLGKRVNGFGGCPTETVLRNGAECDINVGDFDKETDKRIGQSNKKKTSDPLLDMLDGNVGEIVDKIAKIETAVELDKLFKAESDGKTRKGVIEAIEFRDEELKGKE